MNLMHIGQLLRDAPWRFYQDPSSPDHVIEDYTGDRIHKVTGRREPSAATRKFRKLAQTIDFRRRSSFEMRRDTVIAIKEMSRTRGETALRALLDYLKW